MGEENESVDNSDMWNTKSYIEPGTASDSEVETGANQKKPKFFVTNLRDEGIEWTSKDDISDRYFAIFFVLTLNWKIQMRILSI